MKLMNETWNVHFVMMDLKRAIENLPNYGFGQIFLNTHVVLSFLISMVHINTNFTYNFYLIKYVMLGKYIYFSLVFD